MSDAPVVMPEQAAVSVSPEPAAVSPDEAMPVPSGSTPWIIGVWRRLLREPALVGTVVYVLVSFIGLWANYWYYSAFGLPILEYMQGSDYLVAGLREPAYVLCLVAALLLAGLVSWPELWRRQHPQRAEALRARWWGRALFPNAKLFRWWWLTPETGTALASLGLMMVILTNYSYTKAQLIRDKGTGHAVQVTLMGASSPLPGEARLLGTSSSFVFLWWPDERRVEAVAISNVGRLQALGKGQRTVVQPAPPVMPASVPVAEATPSAP